MPHNSTKADQNSMSLDLFQGYWAEAFLMTPGRSIERVRPSPGYLVCLWITPQHKDEWHASLVSSLSRARSGRLKADFFSVLMRKTRNVIEFVEDNHLVHWQWW